LSDLGDDVQEIEFLVSSGGGNVVFVVKSGTHFSGDVQELLVLVSLVGSLLDNSFFLDDTKVHGVDVSVESLVDGSEVVEVLVKNTGEYVESINFILLVYNESVKTNSDLSEEIVDQFSDSSNSVEVDEFVFFRGSHLGEGNDNWGISTDHTGFDTSLDHSSGVLGKLDEVTFTGS